MSPFRALTFSHVTKGVLVGFIGGHATWHVRCVHARLVAGVGGLPGKCGVAAIREGVLQVDAAPWRGVRNGNKSH